jgi:hypothetical protein
MAGVLWKQSLPSEARQVRQADSPKANFIKRRTGCPTSFSLLLFAGLQKVNPSTPAISLDLFARILRQIKKMNPHVCPYTFRFIFFNLPRLARKSLREIPKLGCETPALAVLAISAHAVSKLCPNYPPERGGARESPAPVVFCEAYCERAYSMTRVVW